MKHFTARAMISENVNNRRRFIDCYQAKIMMFPCKRSKNLAFDLEHLRLDWRVQNVALELCSLSKDLAGQSRSITPIYPLLMN
jgi:hypothetical protein